MNVQRTLLSSAISYGACVAAISALFFMGVMPAQAMSLEEEISTLTESVRELSEIIRDMQNGGEVLGASSTASVRALTKAITDLEVELEAKEEELATLKAKTNPNTRTRNKIKKIEGTTIPELEQQIASRTEQLTALMRSLEFAPKITSPESVIVLKKNTPITLSWEGTNGASEIKVTVEAREGDTKAFTRILSRSATSFAWKPKTVGTYRIILTATKNGETKTTKKTVTLIEKEGVSIHSISWRDTAAMTAAARTGDARTKYLLRYIDAVGLDEIEVTVARDATYTRECMGKDRQFCRNILSRAGFTRTFLQRKEATIKPVVFEFGDETLADIDTVSITGKKRGKTYTSKHRVTAASTTARPAGDAADSNTQTSGPGDDGCNGCAGGTYNGGTSFNHGDPNPGPGHENDPTRPIYPDSSSDSGGGDGSSGGSSTNSTSAAQQQQTATREGANTTNNIGDR